MHYILGYLKGIRAQHNLGIVFIISQHREA